MDAQTSPPPIPPAPQDPSPQSLPNQVSTSHLANTPANPNLNISQTTPPTFDDSTTPAPNPAPSAIDIPPPSPGGNLGSIIPQDPPEMSGRSVFDQPPKPKQSIYSSSLPSVFFRNFIAGFAKALGGSVVFLLLTMASAYYLSIYFWPHIQPMLQALNNISSTQSGVSSTNNIDPQLVQQAIQELQK